jgi:hypothetical protein
VEKRERVRNIFSPIILRLLGRILSREEGKGTEIVGKKICFEKVVGKNIKF